MRVTLCIAILFFLSFSIAAPFEDLYTDDANIAIKWARLHFEIMRNPDCDFTPPMAGRALAVVQNTIYDTWSYFDSTAAPTIEHSINKRSGSSRDITTAISVAGWRSLLHVYKDMAVYHFVKTEADELLFQETGLTNPTSRNSGSPEGVANIIADDLMDFCDGDGANNYGTAPFTSPAANGEVVYKDYTNYFPVNDPLVTSSRTTVEDCSQLKSINKWQPLTTPLNVDGTGSTTQVYFSPHMSNVRGFALPCSGQLRPRGPPVHGLNAEGRTSFKDQHDEVLEYSATLDDRGKIISEYWLPTLEFGNPPSHFMFFGMNALIKENRNLGDSVKLLMALANSQFDAGIAAWDAKRYFDSSRPITAIRCMYAGEQVSAWAGPYLGVQRVNAGDWMPYQPINFVSPPFSEYVSGHSTFAMAGAVVLEKFFGPEFVGPNSVTTLPGESVIEPIITDPSDPFYIEGVTDVPNQGFNTVGYSPSSTVVLSWDTWRDAARESGISRLYGGVHIQDGNEDGLDLGDEIGELVWDKATDLFAGEASFSSFSSNSFSESSSSASTLPVPMLFLVIALICSLMKQ